MNNLVFEMSKEILDLIADVNPVEIDRQIKENNLENWCESLQDRIRQSILYYYTNHSNELKAQLGIKNHIETQTRQFAKAHECCGGCID